MLAAFRKADNKRVARNIGDPTKSGPMGGWDQMRQRLKGRNGVPMLYFFPNCSDSIRTIPVLQHDETKSEDLDCWIAGTMVATPSGDMPIESIKVGDLVETPLGPRPILRSYLSGAGGTTWILLSDGRYLQGTSHHKIYIEGKGLMRLDQLLCYDIPIGRIMAWQRKPLFIVVSFIHATRAAFTTIRRNGFSVKAALQAYIGRFGLMPDERSLSAGMFTTSMKITTITNWQILNVCRQENMEDSTCKKGLRANWVDNLQNGVSSKTGKRILRENARKMHERTPRRSQTCGNCGCTFQTRHPRQLFCSESCGESAGYRQIEKICGICGKMFWAKHHFNQGSPHLLILLRLGIAQKKRRFIT